MKTDACVSESGLQIGGGPLKQITGHRQDRLTGMRRGQDADDGVGGLEYLLPPTGQHGCVRRRPFEVERGDFLSRIV